MFTNHKCNQYDWMISVRVENKVNSSRGVGLKRERDKKKEPLCGNA